MIVPWKKRLKTTPNAVRRAGLLAAPFVLLGAGKAEADTAFTNFAFPGNPALLPGGIARTQPDRIGEGFVSVREFGSITSGATCRATMQTAFNSGHNLYFPQGIYDIDGPIDMPNDNFRRVIIGAGPNSGDFLSWGTVVRANPPFRDYLWKSQQVYSAWSPISSISGMAFNNSYKVPVGDPITQVDPPGVGPHPGNGCGCLYFQLSWTRITNVIFGLSSGVALYFPGINNYISTFNVNGVFGGVATAPFTCGIWGGGRIGNGKMHDCRYGIVAIQGPTSLSDMDIERCQWGVMTTNPIPFWDRNMDVIIPAMSETGGSVSMVGLNFESCGSESEGGGALYAKGTMDISGFYHTGSLQIGVPDYHILLDNAGGLFKHINVGGHVNVAGIATKAYSQVFDCIFTGCASNVQASKPAWEMFPRPDDAFNRQKGAAGKNGNKFIGCNTNGAIRFNQLPFSNPAVFNELLITDSPLPEIDYTTATPTANRGKIVLAGGGTNLTCVVCRPIISLAAIAAWTVDATVLTVTANPGAVLPGMIIWNSTTGLYVGAVGSFIGTVLTLAKNPNADISINDFTAGVPGSAGDILTFSCWTVV